MFFIKIWFDTVSLGQQVFISGEEYVCEGIMKCSSRESGTEYCEFKLVRQKYHSVRWLEVELDSNGMYNAVLYSEIDFANYHRELKKQFKDCESFEDRGKVLKITGNIDASKGNSFRYIEHYFEDEVLCDEYWYGENEYSWGKEIEMSSIRVGDIIKKVPKMSLDKIFNLIVYSVIGMFLIIPSFFDGAFASHCSDTCTRTNKDYCCISSDKCWITNKKCKSMYSSVRSSSTGTRRYSSGSSSFGK